MFLGDGAGVANVDDLLVVVDGPDRNRVLANLRRNVFLDFKAQILQHQVA